MLANVRSLDTTFSHLLNYQKEITTKLQAYNKQTTVNVYDLRLIKDNFNEPIIFE